MRKTLRLLLLLAAPLLLSVACDDNDDYYYRPGNGGGQDNGELNQYEKKLVGSYVSDDDPLSVFYLVLNKDRTGKYRSVSNGEDKGEAFTWRATTNRLIVRYTNDDYETPMEYYYSNDHLYVDGIRLVENEGNTPGEEESPLLGQWQGKADGYYEIMWGLGSDTCASVMEFAANGNGCQLDYDVYRPRTDYAYIPFTWKQTENSIAIRYALGSGQDAVISNFALTSNKFTGTIAYNDTASFRFKYDRVYGFDWSPYITGTATARQHLRTLMRTASGPVRKGAFARQEQPAGIYNLP